ncbi:podocalyxin-like [Sinocyclocheilus grahami]|uniref:Podocalyxin-like n=1 Tax=Sinocyclocheilus grahami TaxID=75366 RepID=A0A672JW86_SINGR|nr:PREDICTED: podocalyxin-like [Sinocyclocheilus grahami]
MKDMGRCGNIAFCAMVLFYCSFITGDYLCVSSAAHISRRRNGVTDVNMTSSSGGDQTQSSTNITNSTEPTPHSDTTTETLMNSSALAENVSFSGNITDSRNDSDVSPVNNETAVTTVKPTTLLPSTTHEPTSSIHTSTRAPAASSPESTSARSKQKSTPPASSLSTAAAPALTTQMTAMKAHGDTPSALNVGDHDNSKVSTDPLLAGLVSAFVVVAAIVSVLVFLKFRHTSDGPEFRRLQDLPMDDMLEDAPLSMYSY